MPAINFLDLDLATLTGPITKLLFRPRSLPVLGAITVGFAKTTPYQAIIPAELDTYFYHDGQRFIRCAPSLNYKTYQELPERGPQFSSLLHPSHWLSLLGFEEQQFGAFGCGDVLRISEAYYPSTRNISMRTPLFHSDEKEETTADKFIEEPHAYLVAGQHQILNTEVPAQRLPPVPHHIVERLNNKGNRGQDHKVSDWLRTHGGTRRLASFEVTILPLRLPHRSSPAWGDLDLADQEFGRMKVLRANMPRFALRPCLDL